MKPYAHEPFTDFSKKENQAAFLEGLKKVESYLGETYDLIIGGKRVETNDKIVSINPANKEEVIGYVGKATKEHAEEAVQEGRDCRIRVQRSHLLGTGILLLKEENRKSNTIKTTQS